MNSNGPAARPSGTTSTSSAPAESTTRYTDPSGNLPGNRRTASGHTTSGPAKFAKSGTRSADTTGATPCCDFDGKTTTATVAQTTTATAAAAA
ncbi:hypothetical protein Pa4123_66090 [Phytohabitans aurantiacus]|uniref:Uncharacterized protein n=1 Tax=Phytohabitans aurantiacus TaxID=3016789 RepID=A0ABQ5R4Q4_9ACTN|nr:hypothetical protein Pa4123_66090 [Phytohabitans aurantiacus]